MMHTTQTLYDNLGSTLLEINKQIEAVKRDVLLRLPGDFPADPDAVYDAKNSDGSFVLTDLLAAKAQALSGMAALKTAEMASKRPPGAGRKW